VQEAIKRFGAEGGSMINRFHRRLASGGGTAALRVTRGAIETPTTSRSNVGRRRGDRRFGRSKLVTSRSQTVSFWLLSILTVPA